MTLYSSMIPFFVITGLAGVAVLAYLFQQMRRPLLAGGVVGLAAGLAGPMLFMGPLQACTFEPEADTIDYHFGIFLFMVGAALVIAFAQWLSRFLLARGKARAGLVDDTNKGTFNVSWIIPILLLLPTLIILALFLYYPAFDTFRLSTLLTRIGAPRTAFRCVSNFTELMEPTFTPLFYGVVVLTVAAVGGLYYLRHSSNAYDANIGRLRTLIGVGLVLASYLFLRDLWDDNYREVFFNTVFISGMIVVLGLIISLGIAYLVFQPVKGASIYRTLLIWPYAISPPIAGILFFVMFDSTAGIIDHFFDVILSVDLPNYKQDTWLARWVVIIASVWKTLGYNILFYIAGLQNVSKELVEAAAIDGANAWQRFRNVIVPALSPITFFLIITNLTYAFFETYGTIDYLTRGAPAGATSVAIYEIIEIGITQKSLGRGAAQSVLLFILVIGVTIWQFRTSGRRVSYGA